jgi:hypothetical protein
LLFCAYAVTVPEGGVEKGQEFEVPSPPEIKADPTKSTPATVMVTAPSTLEAGFTFEAVADGKTFTGELRCSLSGRGAQRVKKQSGSLTFLAFPLLLFGTVFVPLVTVPEGGVEKGQEFEVPYPSDAMGGPQGKFKVRTGTR